MNYTCPFCGSSNVVIVTETQGIVERVMYWVRCRMCNATGPWKTERANAIAAWNQNFIRRQTASIGEDE